MGGGLNKKQNDALDAIFEAFDDDALAAVKAISWRFKNMSAERNSAVVKNPVINNNPVLLTVSNLTKTYKVSKQKVPVLKGISLDIREGEFVAITGSSGSGKSTLLQIIGGLDRPTDGEVLFNGLSLAKLSDKKLSEFRRQTVGFVFQFFYLQPFLRLRDNLEVPAMFSGRKRSERRKDVADLAKRVGLEDRLGHFPKELSGGQMQRAAIARALLNKPKILLADEPTGNLDSKNSAAIVQLFEHIRKELGTAIVVVTHDPEIAKRADREIHLKDGVIV